MHTQLSEAIAESLKGFSKPQPTQVVYFDLLQSLQNRFLDFDRWKLRVELLAAIDRRNLGKNDCEIARLLCQALREVEAGFEERQRYEMGLSNF